MGGQFHMQNPFSNCKSSQIIDTKESAVGLQTSTGTKSLRRRELNQQDFKMRQQLYPKAAWNMRWGVVRLTTWEVSSIFIFFIWGMYVLRRTDKYSESVIENNWGIINSCQSWAKIQESVGEFAIIRATERNRPISQRKRILEWGMAIIKCTKLWRPSIVGVIWWGECK